MLNERCVYVGIMPYLLVLLSPFFTERIAIRRGVTITCAKYFVSPAWSALSFVLSDLSVQVLDALSIIP